MRCVLVKLQCWGSGIKLLDGIWEMAVQLSVHIIYSIYSIQGVTGGMCETSGECSLGKLYRYNPKHLYPKLNGYGNSGQRKEWTSLVSVYCTRFRDVILPSP